MIRRRHGLHGSVRSFVGPSLAVLTFGLLASLPSPVAAQTPPKQPCVTLPAGATVCGTTDPATVGTSTVEVPAYKGIRYARQPVKSLRWQPPKDTVLSGTVQATEFGPVCIQPPSRTDTQRRAEDCLFLNVWAPPSATGSSRLPVMVFIHGGAYVIGSGSSPLYNGAYLAASNDVVVVTLNYRLGALGFLPVAAGNGRGNFGLMDQQKALEWVQGNIAAFGGDPTKVTLFGESAGAMSVGFHLFAVPSSDRLFRAAIMQSNPMGVRYRGIEAAHLDAGSFAHMLCKKVSRHPLLDCSNAAAALLWLKAASADVPVDSILSAQQAYDTTGAMTRLIRGGLAEGLPWTPVVDNSLVRGQPYEGYARAAGMRAKPFVFGMNRDEGVVFAAFAQAEGGGKLNPQNYRLALARLFPGRADDIVKQRGTSRSDPLPYQPHGHPSIAGMDSTASALAEVITDFTFDCGNLAAADTAFHVHQKATPTAQIYGYLFAQKPFFNLYNGVEACDPAYQSYACHAYELPYVFNTLTYAAGLNGNKLQPTRADSLIAQRMARAWGSFATDPTRPPVDPWSAYNPEKGTLYVFTGSENGTSDQSYMQPTGQTTLSASANCTALWYTMPPLNSARSKKK